MDFYVSGYMNSGDYEGRVGMVIYTYEHAERVREEKLYMPVNSSHQVFASDISGFAYIGDGQVFYFSIYDRIYAFDLATNELSTIADGVDTKQIVFCKEENYIAWKEKTVRGKNDSICILYLDSSVRFRITSPVQGIRPFGRINNNLIYGYERESDGIRQLDGSIDRPCYKLMIADGKCNVLKVYDEPGVFISDVEIGENIITIKRVVRNEAGTMYTSIDDDTILNRLEQAVDPVPIVKYVTDRMLTEYSVAIPVEEEIASKPVLYSVGNKVLNHETLVRLPDPDVSETCYYTYSFGRIVLATEKASEAIASANKNVGTVINRDGRLIWERGIKMPRTEIQGIKEIKAGGDVSSIQAAINILAEFRECEIDVSQYEEDNDSIYDFLCTNMKPSIVDMTGSELDDVLYSVYRGHPVIALRGNGEACVIYGYEPSTISVYDPSRGSRLKITMADAIKDFKKNGNIFISYVG